jgi:hypothetical protein
MVFQGGRRFTTNGTNRRYTTEFHGRKTTEGAEKSLINQPDNDKFTVKRARHCFNIVGYIDKGIFVVLICF